MHIHNVSLCFLANDFTTTRNHSNEPGPTPRQCSQAQPTTCHQHLPSSVMGDRRSLSWPTNCIWVIGKEAQPNRLNIEPVRLSQVCMLSRIQLPALRLSLITRIQGRERLARELVPDSEIPIARRTWAVLHPVKGRKAIASPPENERLEGLLPLYQQLPRANVFQCGSLGCGLRLPCLARPVHKPHLDCGCAKSPRTSAF